MTNNLLEERLYLLKEFNIHLNPIVLNTHYFHIDIVDQINFDNVNVKNRYHFCIGKCGMTTLNAYDDVHVCEKCIIRMKIIRNKECKRIKCGIVYNYNYNHYERKEICFDTDKLVRSLAFNTIDLMKHISTFNAMCDLRKYAEKRYPYLNEYIVIKGPYDYISKELKELIAEYVKQIIYIKMVLNLELCSDISDYIVNLYIVTKSEFI